MIFDVTCKIRLGMFLELTLKNWKCDRVTFSFMCILILISVTVILKSIQTALLHFHKEIKFV